MCAELCYILSVEKMIVKSGFRDVFETAYFFLEFSLSLSCYKYELEFRL